MRSKPLVWISGGFLILCLVNIAIAALTVMMTPNPIEITATEDEAQIFLSVRYMLHSHCADVYWKVDHIRSVSLNGAGQVGEGRQQICGQKPVLQVEFQDGSVHDYAVKSINILELQRSLLVALASGIVGLVLYSEYSSGLVAYTLPNRAFALTFLTILFAGLFTLALILPDMPLFQKLIAALPFASNGTPTVGHIALIALTTTFFYWVFTPPALRTGIALFMSVILFALEGASLELITLVVLLSLTVQVIADDPPPDPAPIDEKPSTLLVAVGLSVLGTLFVCLPLVGPLTTTAPIFPAVMFVLAAVGFALYRPVVKWHSLFPHQPALPIQRQSWLAWGAGIGITFFLTAAIIAVFTFNLNWLLTLSARLILIPLLLAGGIALSVLNRSASRTLRLRISKAIIVYLVLLFIMLKSTFGGTIGIVGWVGFSYITFRLLHVLFERLGNRETGNASPAEMLLYVLFFPAILIGPIDRLPRFLSDVRGKSVTFQWSVFFEGIVRIFIGGVKKFLLADLLFSRLALTSTLTPDMGIAFAWVQLYMSAFYLFLDFSGFTDIAIGMGLLLGYSLPDNFNNPYWKNNLAQFWQSWHITLSSWLRTYIFLPLSRSLLRTRLGRYPSLVVFCTQMVTMLLIGLWHGITFNFALWGIWHGAGLFTQKIFSDRTRRRQMHLKNNRFVAPFMNGVGIFLTFHFVALGWVFFMLSTPAESIRFLMRLIGQ